MRRLPSVGLVLLLVAGSLAVLPLAAPPARAAGQVSVYMTGLNFPIALAFSDNRTFYSERNTGSIRIIENGSLLPTPFYTLSNTATAGERGLLGLALDPGFPASPWVYAYQTYMDTVNGTVYNRIVRILANGNAGVSHSVILRMPPLSPATNHNGGVIAFGPDGKLYAVVGENAIIPLAQDLTSPMGKVLRMNPDGSAPADNPYYGNLSVDNLIYTYGHRNMFGLAWHPATGRPYATENGPNCNDEVNLLPNLTAPDRNFGWGTMQSCLSPPPPPQNTNRDGPNPILPIIWWTPPICPTNAAIYSGAYFPAFQGDLFMGDCNTRRLHRLDLVPPAYNTVASDVIVYTAPISIIEVEQGPDGAIWFTTPTTIYRYWDSGQPPVPAFTASPNPTTPGTLVAFDGTASSDPDGTIVSYAWEFGDSNTGGGVTASHTYAVPGAYVVNLTVVDNSSMSDTATETVVVNGPPVAAFSYTPTSIYIAVVVTFDGSASTDDVGVVSWTWDFGDGAMGSGSSATHAYTRKGVFLVTLTVEDDLGLTDARTTPVRVQNRAPRIISSDPDLVPVELGPGLNRSFTVVATDPDADFLTYVWRVDGVVTGGNASTLYVSRPEGVYRVNVTISDGSLATWGEWTVTVTASGTGVDAALPWIAGAILGAVLVLLLIAVWWRRRKPEAAPPAPPESPPPPPPLSAPPPPPPQSTPPPSP